MLEIISPTAWRVYWDRLWSPTTSYPVDYKRIATDLYALESVCEQSELFGYEYKNTRPTITVVLIQYALIIEDMTWPRAWMWILSSSAKKFVSVVSYKSYWLQKYWLHITWKIVFKEAECRYHLRKWHLFSDSRFPFANFDNNVNWYRRKKTERFKGNMFLNILVTSIDGDVYNYVPRSPTSSLFSASTQVQFIMTFQLLQWRFPVQLILPNVITCSSITKYNVYQTYAKIFRIPSFAVLSCWHPTDTHCWQKLTISNSAILLNFFPVKFITRFPTK